MSLQHNEQGTTEQQKSPVNIPAHHKQSNTHKGPEQSNTKQTPKQGWQTPKTPQQMCITTKNGVEVVMGDAGDIPLGVPNEILTKDGDTDDGDNNPWSELGKMVDSILEQMPNESTDNNSDDGDDDEKETPTLH